MKLSTTEFRKAEVPQSQKDLTRLMSVLVLIINLIVWPEVARMLNL